MTPDEYAREAADRLYIDGTPTAARIVAALADAYQKGRNDGHTVAYRTGYADALEDHGWKAGP